MENSTHLRGLQLKWIGRFALIFVFSSLALLLFLRKILNRELGEDYSQAFYSMKQLDSSLFAAVGIPVAVYVLVVSLLVSAVKLFFTHTIAGPLFRMESCARSLDRGDLSFYSRVRAGDHLKRLSAAMGELKDDLRRPILAVRESCETITGLARELESPEGIEEKLARLETELDKLQSALGK